jgi:hypothetical protein
MASYTAAPPAWLALDLEATILGAALCWSARLGQDGAVLLSLHQAGLILFCDGLHTPVFRSMHRSNVAFHCLLAWHRAGLLMCCAFIKLVWSASAIENMALSSIR